MLKLFLLGGLGTIAKSEAVLPAYVKGFVLAAAGLIAILLTGAC